MSGRIFGPVELFSALSIVTRGDPDLPDGVHLRLVPSPLIGFPVAPFGIYELQPALVELENSDLFWRDRDGRVRTDGDLAAARGLLTVDILRRSDEVLDVAVEVLSDDTFEGTVELLDRVGNRVLSSVSRRPFVLGGPRVERLRIEGRASGPLGLRVWRLYGVRELELLLGGQPNRYLSLPVDGSRAWYANGRGEAPALDRVRSAAPKRLGPPDQPNGPFAALTPEDEALRVLAHKRETLDACDSMLGDPSTFPAQKRLARDEPAAARRPRQLIDIAVAATLLAQAMDPGLGRYLGLVDHVARPPNHPTVYAAVGLFAIDQRVVLPDGRRLPELVADMDPFVMQVADRLAGLVGARETIDRLRQTWGSAIAVRGLFAVAAAVPAPDAPALPRLRAGSAAWLDGAGAPSKTFRQAIVVEDAPLGSLVALGRLDAGTWKTRHETIELPPAAHPRTRALALLLGRTGERPPLAPKGLISDAPVPAGAARYRVALADLFGRFGRHAELPVTDPPRPGPPKPAPRVDLVLDGPAGDQTGPTSPGHLDVNVPVPAITERAAGALELASLHVDLDGDARTVPVQAAPAHTVGTAHARIELPKLTRGEQRHGKLTATFRDTAGAVSEPAVLAIPFADRRRPPRVLTARGIIWTSRPGPSPEVELRLSWQGAKNVQYRAYVADEKSLGLSGSTRAEVAKDGTDRDIAGTLGDRSRFRLLTEPPLTAGADGRVTMLETLPRSLSTVQFLRIVPATAGGQEAQFEQCRVVPVAVPSDRRPPAPRVGATVDTARGRAKVTVEAVGLDLVELAAAEPGLFTNPPKPDAAAPEVLVRRSAGAVGEPLYARELKSVPLKRGLIGGAVVFVAEVDDPHDLAPFVRYSYWAQVRMPPERRLAQGATEIPPPAGVLPADPAQIADMPRAFSLASAPASVLYVPAVTPDRLPDAAAAIGREAGKLRMSLSAPASLAVHPLAVAPYRLRLWEQWGADDIVSAGPDLALNGGSVDWTGQPHPDTPAAHTATLRYAIVDPLGRQGPIQTLAAPLVAWEPLGGLFTSSPAACSPSPGHLAAFGRGLDDRLYWRRFDGAAWTAGWDVIAPELVGGGPAVASTGDGTIHLVVLGSDESGGYYKRFDGAAWTGWQPIGWFTSGVAIAAASAQAVRVFGTRHQSTWWTTWDGTAWSAWQPLPGEHVPAADLAALATAGDGVELAVRSPDGRLYHRSLAAGTWTGWAPLGDFVAGSAPALAVTAPGELTVLAQGQDGRVWWNRIRAGVQSGWSNLGPAQASGAPAATVPAAGRVDVFVRGTDNAMYHRWSDGTWHP